MKNTHQTLSQWRDKFNSKNIDYTLTQIDMRHFESVF